MFLDFMNPINLTVCCFFTNTVKNTEYSYSPKEFFFRSYHHPENVMSHDLLVHLSCDCQEGKRGH